MVLYVQIEVSVVTSGKIRQNIRLCLISYIFVIYLKNNSILYTPWLLINYMWLYVGIHMFLTYRHIHCGILILRLDANVQYICNLFEALQGLFFLLNLKQEHEERERFLHHLRKYKYCCVNTVIFFCTKFVRRFWFPLHCCVVYTH